ncbi:MinD/ParA family protein [Arthrobacter ginkgonis]|uniref:MinD/ParA family protein n=1 Tax=Arthrobacter ginkgonis TaxID=1630594 RepID=A0ABP7CBG1_9MICC
MSQENTAPKEPVGGEPAVPDRTPTAAGDAGAWVPVEQVPVEPASTPTPPDATPPAASGEAHSKEEQPGSDDPLPELEGLQELEELEALGASVDDAFAHADTPAAAGTDTQRPAEPPLPPLPPSPPSLEPLYDVVAAGEPEIATWEPEGLRTPDASPPRSTEFPAREAATRSRTEPSESAAPSAVVTPEPAAALTAERLLEPRVRPPVGGWRLWLYRATMGRVNVGDSDVERLRRITANRIAVPLGEGTRYVPVLSRKGGVGKTTVTTLLGMALAQGREDRVIALDANPDRGTLSDRSPGKARHTARQLVQNRFMVDSFTKLSSYAAREGSRLDVLASDPDPHVALAFDDADYRAVTDLLSKYYSIVLTDSGTGMVHSVMKGTLEKAHAVVLVSGASVDEARLASETLSWLEAHGREDLAARAIVVINQSLHNGRAVNVEEIEAHFRTRAAHVVRLPYDPHLAEGSRVDLSLLRPATHDAVHELAALVADSLRG